MRATIKDSQKNASGEWEYKVEDSAGKGINLNGVEWFSEDVLTHNA
jgi:hypothetical protein